MNTTVYTLEGAYQPVRTGDVSLCAIQNRSTVNKVYVDLTDDTGPDTYELLGQGDKVNIDLTGAKTITVRADHYPTDILISMTNQRADLASPAMDVSGGLNAVSPLPVTVVSTSTPTFFDFTEQAGDPAAADGVVRAYGKTSGLFYIDDESVVHGPLIDKVPALTIDTQAGVPAGAPAAGHLPLNFDSTAVSGGLYAWYGGAWHKVSVTP
jgi:hypothetical protein